MNLDLNRKLAEKEQSFRIFDSIYKRYDLLNRLLSLGQDISWRRKLAKAAGSDGKQLLLDLAAGTGDVAFSMLKHNRSVTHAYGCDMARNMLQLAQKKAHKKKVAEKFSILQGDAGNIPFADNSFHIASIAFGIRNTPNPPHVLTEMHRILKKNGKALILEFSLPQNTLIKKFHLFYLRKIIPHIGTLVSGDRDAYRYLNKTIESFPYGESFCRWMRDAGFKNVGHTPLTFGVVTLYRGEK